MNRILSAGALALTTAGLLAAVPAAHAAGPNTCIYNPASKNVGVKLVSGGFVELEREGNKLVTFDAFGKTVCTSSTGIVATVANTGAIFMNGSLSAKDDFIVSFGGGDLAPGAPTTNGDQSHAEVVIFNDATDIVDVAGSAAGDFITVMGGQGTSTLGGVRVNGNLNDPAPSIKFQSTNPSVLRVNGLGGDDFITGNGVFGTATTMHLELTGGAGNDNLASGLIGGDKLFGEGGDDSLGTKQGQKGDINSGGDGNDRASLDAAGDSAFAVETINNVIGKPKVTHSALKHGQTTVDVSWTHPRAWKQLANVTLGAFLGTERVGTVTMTPATGKIAAHGALSLTADAALAHKGKTVSAKLALKVAKSVDARQLRLEIEATDKAGKVQNEVVAGLLS
jgi:hypothetical protein